MLVVFQPFWVTIIMTLYSFYRRLKGYFCSCNKNDSLHLSCTTMQKHNLIFFGLSIICFSTVFAQKRNTQAAWQQEVNYKINVILDTTSQQLHGIVAIDYLNHSPDTLKEIYMHLWPNAYKNNETAFARQQIENRKTKYYLSPPEERGFIDSITFAVDGQIVFWEYTQEIDIARIVLKQPILPHSTVRIVTPFRVQLPAIYSRMGHENGVYCITQWYPKPAVYDINGWNAMPYLDQGEFYSEFGSYDVSITVPSEMVVAATGNLQTTAEKLWWYDKINNNNTPNPSSQKTKTLRFTQDKVHDFAWFASHKFHITKGEVNRTSGKTIDTWLFSTITDTVETRAGVNYINNGIRLYSNLVGEYPFDQATVVITPLKAGAGMEYPTITNCASIDETTIIHEVGHNWFYGIIGSNERDHPWMDESINTYYENRGRMDLNMVPQHSGVSTLIQSFQDGKTINDLYTPFEITEMLYQFPARRNEDQASTIHSTEFTNINYGAILYAQTPKLFYYLQRYLGDSIFDSMMQDYYRKWQFKHPLPDDFRMHVQNFTGKPLNWFFDVLMNTNTKQDYKIKSFHLKNDSIYLNIKSNTNSPFPVSAIKHDSIIYTKWFDAHETISIPNGDYDLIRIDAYEETMDLYRHNNSIRTKGVMKTWKKTRLGILADIENPYHHKVFIAPIAGANLYNKTMMGVAIYNSVLPNKKTEYIFTPAYAFGTKDINGFAQINHKFSYSTGKIKDILIGLNFTRFAYMGFYSVQDIGIDNIAYQKSVRGNITYEKLEPRVEFKLKKKYERTSPDEMISLRYFMINEQKQTDAILSNFKNHSRYFLLSYHSVNERLLQPYTVKIQTQYGHSLTPFGNQNSEFMKLSAEGTYKINYSNPKQGLSIRGFVGTFLTKSSSSDERAFYRAGSNLGMHDYLFEQSQFGRTETNGLFANQLMFGDLEFKELYPKVFTNTWASVINVETNIPGILPIVIYADFALINNIEGFLSTNGFNENYVTKFIYTSGIAINIRKNLFRINLPLMASAEIADYFAGKENGKIVGPEIPYRQRITFSFSLNRLNPYKGVKNINLN